MEALQQQVQALQNALAAIQAAGPAPAAMHPPPPAAVFARAPAQLNHAALLNYMDKKDIELHKSGSAALPGDPYDGKANLQSWLNKVESRALSFGMIPILTINGELLTRRFGEITKAQILQAVMIYQNARGRNAQNSEILYNCLVASITEEVLARVNVEQDQFEIEAQVDAIQVETVKDGVLFLKAIIDNTYTNTRSNATLARENLSSLDSYMAKLPKSDVTKFNQYVKVNTKELAAANEATTDLVMNLFKGYRKAKDKTFRNWLQREYDDYITRRTIIHPNGLDLMAQVENYYKDRLNSGEWMKLDDEQETILALKAQIAGNKQYKGGGEPNKGKKTKKGKENTPPTKPTWRSVAPKSGEPASKERDGKTWNWCVHHKELTVHTSGECRKKDEKKEEKKTDGKKKKNVSNNNSYKMKVMSALAEISSDDGTDHEGEESEGNTSL